MQYTHEFTVQRIIGGEKIEIDLRVQMDVGHDSAQIDGTIFEIQADGESIPWDGHLTSTERNFAESEAFENWSDADMDEVRADYDEDGATFNESYLPEFHDERAIRICGGGKVMF